VALLRRLEKRILVPLPTIEAREAMVKHYLPPGPKGIGRAEESVDFNSFAEKLDGYSGSDIRLVCKESAMKPLRRIMQDINILESAKA
jgi:katanin p60 ATPase-containing subunit A1